MKFKINFLIKLIEAWKMTRKGLLMRVGIDQTFGQYNAPINPKNNDYMYIPIPESKKTFRLGMETNYENIELHLREWGRDNNCEISLPSHLRRQGCHLDPDFENLSYGDQGTGRGNRVSKLNRGDFLVFFASFRPITPCEHRLVYAIFGIIFVEEVVRVRDMPELHWSKNAHSRVNEANPDHLVVLGQSETSGRFGTAIPIGELRNRSYRVQQPILEAWNGLDVKDGFIQRSVCPPWFLDSTAFLKWLELQQVKLNKNNG